jgi:hypothetical protein
MGSIKDIVDLITKLRNSIQDRKIVSELLQIQSYIDSLHSECLHAKERALEYKTDNAQLKEDMIEIKRQVRRLKDSHAQEILDMRMIHGAEMAGADDAHESTLKELKELHAFEIAALLSNPEGFEKQEQPKEWQEEAPSTNHGAAHTTHSRYMNQNRNKIPQLLKRLYEIVAELESRFPGRKFTPDGHLVGSLGEVIAAHDYDLILLESSAKTHDARKGSKQIQIKVTQGKSVAMYGEPEHLLVLRLLKNGTTEEIYNGPGKPAWDNAGKPQRNGQSSISLSRLRVLMKTVPDSQKVKKE